MTDPTVIPWGVAWFGLILLICGATLALHGISQRRPSRVANAVGAIIAVSVVLMLGTPLVNGTVMLAKAFGAIAQQAVAAAHPSNQQGAPR